MSLPAKRTGRPEESNLLGYRLHHYTITEMPLGRHLSQTNPKSQRNSTEIETRSTHNKECVNHFLGVSEAPRKEEELWKVVLGCSVEITEFGLIAIPAGGSCWLLFLIAGDTPLGWLSLGMNESGMRLRRGSGLS